MDTITRAAMAVALAEEGGIGVIDRGFRAGDIAPQVAEVTAVKRTQHGIIADPHTIATTQPSPMPMRLMERTGVGTLVVVDEHGAAGGPADTSGMCVSCRRRAGRRSDDAARAAGRPHRADFGLRMPSA